MKFIKDNFEVNTDSESKGSELSPVWLSYVFRDLVSMPMRYALIGENETHWLVVYEAHGAISCMSLLEKVRYMKCNMTWHESLEAEHQSRVKP